MVLFGDVSQLALWSDKQVVRSLPLPLQCTFYL